MIDFRQLNFKRERDYTNKVERARWQFFIPGVNSGSYNPATLHIDVLVRTKTAKWFSLRDSSCYSEISLTKEEFDRLFEEMKKIKAYRDGLTKEFVNNNT